MKHLQGCWLSLSESEEMFKASVTCGDEGVELEVGASVPLAVSEATDKDSDVGAWCRLSALLLAHFTSMAFLWAESVGTAELEALRSFPDAVSNCLGQGAADRSKAMFVVILSDRLRARSEFLMFGQYFPFLIVAEKLYRFMMDRKKIAELEKNEFEHMT